MMECYQELTCYLFDVGLAYQLIQRFSWDLFLVA